EGRADLELLHEVAHHEAIVAHDPPVTVGVSGRSTPAELRMATGCQPDACASSVPYSQHRAVAPASPWYTGGSVRQMSIADEHRSRKRHPDGTFERSGTVP